MSPPSVPHAETGRIGRYTLLARIGEGGMGVVHLAQGPSGHRVALKVLRPHVVGDEEGRARLAREVSSLRRVRSRRVAEVYDADPWGERPYLVTRYVDGPSLHDRVRESGPLPEDELRAVAVGLVEAVIAVHQGGVLHRDIKPSNVLIEGRKEPVLIDFGLAKVAEDSRLTATGWLMGTPGYLAPEVLYGDEATPAADVHSWAATVVFAATGETPFGRGPSMAVMDRARRGEHDLAGVPDSLRPLLEQCLDPEPRRRPHAQDVLARLTAPARSYPPAHAGPTAPAHTRPITVAAPVQAPARRDPQARAPEGPRAATGEPRSHPALRWLLLTGALVAVAAGFAVAPYAAAMLLLLATWAVRVTSWSNESMADRRALRGRRKSDGVVRALTAPWHLAASLFGTVTLVLAVCAAVAAVAVVLAAAGVAHERALFAGGLLGGVTLWWGPGARRVRRSVRRGVWRVTRPGARAAAWIGGVWLLALLLVLTFDASGVLWWPDLEAPFDPRELVPPGFR